MFGILGCGSSKKNATLAASKSGRFAIDAKGGASLVGPRWFGATIWQAEHHRCARRSPLSGSAPDPGMIVAKVAAAIKTLLDATIPPSLRGPAIWDDLPITAAKQPLWSDHSRHPGADRLLHCRPLFCLVRRKVHANLSTSIRRSVKACRSTPLRNCGDPPADGYCAWAS